MAKSINVESVIINSKYNGPPNSGNGGYVCGLLANSTPYDTIEVKLIAPPPLDTEVIIKNVDGRYELWDANNLIASAIRSDIDISVPVIPSMADAILCETRYPGFDRHIFPHCFVCGPQRMEEDGLRLFTGVSGSKDYVAAPFRTFRGLYDQHGHMYPEIIWSALDCPGAYAITQISEEKMMVLGKLKAKIVEPIKREERLIVSGWYMGTDKRKNYAGTAIFTSDGKLKAIGHSVWIEIDPDRFI